jgi:hypothetical protein
MLVLDGEVTLTTPKGTVSVEAGRGTMLYKDDLPPFPPCSAEQGKDRQGS